jgi:hypothetical protein
MEGHEYMKSLLPVPSHSVPLNPMSGGGDVQEGGIVPSTLKAVPEGNNENENLNNYPLVEEKNNNSEPAKVPEAAQVNPSIKQVEKTIEIKELYLGGDIYYMSDVSNAQQIDLSNASVQSFVNDFHLDLLDPEKQKEFIFSVLNCTDLNSIVQGPVCDPLVENISNLITKINEEYSGVKTIEPEGETKNNETTQFPSTETNAFGVFNFSEKKYDFTLPTKLGPSGETIALSGETMALSGETMALSGETMALSGETMALSGETMALSGESKKSVRPLNARNNITQFKTPHLNKNGFPLEVPEHKP